MKAIPISRSLPRAMHLRWWQEGKVSPIDCSSFTCVVHETTLPYTPTITAVDAGQGAFRIEPPTEAIAEQLRRGRRYALTLVLRDNQGGAVQSAELVLEVSR